MVQEGRLRFSANGECRQLAIDFITKEIGRKEYEYAEIKAIRTSTQTLKFLKKHGFNFILSLPAISLLSPVTWYQLIFYGKKITFANRFDKSLDKLKQKKIRFAILNHISPKNLYNISGEYWTHCVASIHQKGTSVLFDPLYNLIKQDYNGIINPPNELILTQKSNSKILIWK